MRVFVYEFLTGGGMLDEIAPCSPHLEREGRAMVRAVSEDFSAIAGCHVDVMRDHRLGIWSNRLPDRVTEHVTRSPADRDSRFDDLAASADYTVVIAPETNGILLRLSSQVQSAGGELLSAPPSFVSVAGDKWQTHQRLRRMGVRVPRSVLGRPMAVTGIPDVDPSLGLVVKPRDGAGSEGITRTLSDRYLCGQRELLLEEFIPGQPASVVAMGGPAGARLLLPCLQQIDMGKGFQYRGGQVLAPEDPRSDRVRRLAASALSNLPPFIGFVGIDLVLGDAEDGSGDTVIEVNPRVTTSYVGLRALARSSLAAAVLAWSQGRACPLEFEHRPLRFTPEGEFFFDDRSATRQPPG